MKKGFTLAEIMIVLAVIGVLTAILLPVAINSSPNEDIMKFKKGHNALLSAIRELVNSDKYYLDGDLGIRANGTMIDGTHDGDVTYFCETLGEILTSNKISCSEKTINKEQQQIIQQGIYGSDDNYEIYNENADKYCKELAETIEEEIVTPDGIVFYQTAPNITFGISYYDQQSSRDPDEPNFCLNNLDCVNMRLFNGPHVDNNGFDRIYKIFCMDIDGIGKGEDPFGYGIRVDGKVALNLRAKEWLQKSIQEKE